MGLPSWAVVTAQRRAHIERVVTLLGDWATAMHVPPPERERWQRAGWLHDALRDAAAASELDHGPLAAARAAQDSEQDRGVLDAVRYHSIGYAGWDDVGRMLYLADYLDPEREFDRDVRRELAGRVRSERDAVLREVARRRIAWTVRSGWPLREETVAFWNALVT